MQSIRTFIPLCTFYFYDVRDVDPLSTALLAFVVLGSGWVSPWIHRNLPAAGLPIIGVLLAICRLSEQVVSRPGIDLIWSGFATALFVVALPLRLLEARAGHATQTTRSAEPVHLGIAFLAGLSIDLLLHLRLRSLDLSWSDGLWPFAVVIPLCLLLALFSMIVRPKHTVLTASTHQPALPASYALTGLWLVFQVQIFGNPASLAAYSGMTWRQTVEVCLVSLMLQFGSIILLGNRFLESNLRRTLAPAFGASVGLYQMGGPWSTGAHIIGSMLGGLLLLHLHIHGVYSSVIVRSKNLARLSCSSGPLLFMLTLFLYYASFEYQLGFASKHVLMIAAAGIALGGFGLVGDPTRWSIKPAHMLPLAAISALLSFLPLPQDSTKSPLLGHLLPSEQPTHTIRVMTYNIHQGFNTNGRLNPDDIAAQIEASGATLVALQEVSRGWVVNGSTDLLEWLAHRLQMIAYFGPTADPLWGNALLSKYPMQSVTSHQLPPDHLSLRRGFLDGRLLVGDRSVRVLATHLHHRRAEGEIRQGQVEELLRVWGRTGSTLIVGDLNDDPMSEAMSKFREAGLTSAALTLPPDQRSTILRPSGDRQLDYMWATADLMVENVAVPISSASDHLPLVATFGLSPQG
jgi:endonuclease/exonuclease/phosphatase family metal-dependent hydrolase